MNLKSNIQLLRLQLPLLFNGVRSRSIVSLALTLFLGLTEGVSLILVIPLLGIAGIENIEGGESKLIELIQSTFEVSGFAVTITNVLILYVLIMTAYSILKYFNTINTTHINRQVVLNWRNAFFSKLTNSSWHSIQSIKNSDIQNTLTIEIAKFGSISNQVVKLMGNIILIATYLAISFLLSPELTLLALVPILLMIMLNRPINKKSLKIGKSTVQFNRQMQQIILEYLTALKLVKTNNKEKQHLKAFETTNEGVEEKMLAFVKVTQSTKALFEILAALLIAIFIYITIVFTDYEVAELLLLILIFSRLLPKATSLVNSYQQILNNLPAINSTLSLVKQLELEKVDAFKKLEVLDLKESISFKEVSFSFGENRVIRNLSFTIPANKTTLIKGKSGVGKTTTIDLIMGLYRTKEGEIQLDGININQLNLNLWKSLIAYVPQDAFLFHKTIRENLEWVNSNLTDKELWEAIEASGAKPFIEALPNGLDTLVGDRGTKLSGGERQRIALARALLRNPKLLILDEATNAIDDKNEFLIKNALQKLNYKMTIIIIAHRSSLLDLADKIIQLD